MSRASGVLIRCWGAVFALLAAQIVAAADGRAAQGWYVADSPHPGKIVLRDEAGMQLRVPLPDMEGVEPCERAEAYTDWVRRELVGRRVQKRGAASLHVGDIDVRGLIVRAGYASSQNDTLRGYVDEARATRSGVWWCADPLNLFRSIAQQTGVHETVLFAIAMNESRRGDAPWPWTLNVAGRGYYFKTREEAWRAANWLLERGRNNFDIGVMQVNWKYNGSRFRSTWEALQPSMNIRVAADIVQENFRKTGTWTDAVRWYHNRVDRERGDAYVARFTRHFQHAMRIHNVPRNDTLISRDQRTDG